MYYVAWKTENGFRHLSRTTYEVLDEALAYAATIHPERDPIVLEEFKPISKRLVIKTKPEPVWRDLKTEDKPVLTGKENLAELLRQKLSYRPSPIE
jgi:hypothetical protein